MSPAKSRNCLIGPSMYVWCSFLMICRNRHNPVVANNYCGPERTFRMDTVSAKASNRQQWSPLPFPNEAIWVGVLIS